MVTKSLMCLIGVTTPTDPQRCGRQIDVKIALKFVHENVKKVSLFC